MALRRRDHLQGGACEQERVCAGAREAGERREEAHQVALQYEHAQQRRQLRASTQRRRRRQVSAPRAPPGHAPAAAEWRLLHPPGTRCAL